MTGSRPTSRGKHAVCETHPVRFASVFCFAGTLAGTLADRESASEMR